jgi:hypothetical protein
VRARPACPGSSTRRRWGSNCSRPAQRPRCAPARPPGSLESWGAVSLVKPVPVWRWLREHVAVHDGAAPKSRREHTGSSCRTHACQRAGVPTHTRARTEGLVLGGGRREVESGTAHHCFISSRRLTLGCCGQRRRGDPVALRRRRAKLVRRRFRQPPVNGEGHAGADMAHDPATVAAVMSAVYSREVLTADVAARSCRARVTAPARVRACVLTVYLAPVGVHRLRGGVSRLSAVSPLSLAQRNLLAKAGRKRQKARQASRPASQPEPEQQAQASNVSSVSRVRVSAAAVVRRSKFFPVDPTVPDRPHRARSITVISMGSVLLPADRSSKPTLECGLDRALC